MALPAPQISDAAAVIGVRWPAMNPNAMAATTETPIATSNATTALVSEMVKGSFPMADSYIVAGLCTCGEISAGVAGPGSAQCRLKIKIGTYIFRRRHIFDLPNRAGECHAKAKRGTNQSHFTL